MCWLEQKERVCCLCLCRESVAINASLMTLGRCLEALRWNQQHRAAEPKLVPYRESKVRLIHAIPIHAPHPHTMPPTPIHALGLSLCSD